MKGVAGAGAESGQGAPAWHPVKVAAEESWRHRPGKAPEWLGARVWRAAKGHPSRPPAADEPHPRAALLTLALALALLGALTLDARAKGRGRAAAGCSAASR